MTMVTVTGKEKHIPERVCIVCKKKSTKNELIRLVKTRKGTVEVEDNGILWGKGIYICNNEECVKGFFKGKFFKKNFHPALYPEAFAHLDKIINTGSFKEGI
jgi:uncharacterized protein